MVCISPLTAIMVEQKAKFVAAGINTDFVGKAQKDPAARKQVIDGQVQLIYISPENIICNSEYQQTLRSAIYKKIYWNCS